jgi:uncharacterized DUF497 family protein
MRFEWNRAKAEQNRRGHEVTFDEAVTVFHDALSATFDDPDHSIAEFAAAYHRLLVPRPIARRIPHGKR